MHQMKPALLGQKAAGSNIKKKEKNVKQKKFKKLKRNKSKILRLESNKREKKEKLNINRTDLSNYIINPR